MVVYELAHELVVDGLHDVEALRRRAHLPRVQERGPGSSLRRDRDVVRHVRADDERILAAQLEVDARDPLGAGDGDALAGVDRTGEGDAVDALVAHDLLADVARAGDDVDHSGRQVLEAVGQRERGQRRHLGRLADGRVAGGERGRELPREQQQRVVPGHDAGDHAHRLLEHERELRGLDGRDHAAGEVAAHLRVVVERRGRPADLVAVLDERLAALERHQPAKLVDAGTQARRHLVQQLGALDRRRVRPAP